MDLDNYCCQKKRVCFANRITTNVQTKKSEKESDERKNEEKERWYHKRPKLKKIISKKGKIKISYSFETLDVNFERHATKHKKKKGSLSCKGHWSPKFSTVLYKLGCHQHCIHVFSSFYTNNYLKDIKTNDFVLMGQLPIKSYFLTYCILQKNLNPGLMQNTVEILKLWTDDFQFVQLYNNGSTTLQPQQHQILPYFQHVFFR